jgi:hypothetical protein
MKYGVEKPALNEFADDLTHLLDNVSGELTLCEMIGELELQIHVLKNRFMGYKQAPKGDEP